MADRGATGRITLREERQAGYTAAASVAIERTEAYFFSPMAQALPAGIHRWLGRFANQAQTPVFTPHVTLFLDGTTYDPLSNLPDFVGTINTQELRLSIGMGAAVGQGSPAPLVIPRAGVFRFRVGLVSNPQTVSIWVKQASNTAPRPKMVVLANPEIGVAADQTVVAGTGSGWVEMTASITAAVPGGAVWVELHNRRLNADPAYFGRP
jgi:hypothetical protein